MKTTTIAFSTALIVASTASGAFATTPKSDELKASVSATYNLKTKSVSPTVTVTKEYGNFSINGFVNFKNQTTAITSQGLNVKAGETYVEEAAYTVQDANRRFGIPLPTESELPGNPGSPYSYDGTRLDGRPIIGKIGDNVFQANRTLITAETDIKREEIKETTGGIEYGIDVRTNVYQDVNGLLAIGVGVKSNGKDVAPYLAANGDTKLSESLSFFADVKVPFNNSGIDVSSGIKLAF